MKNVVWIFGILVIGMIYLAGCGSNKNDNNQVPISAACPVGTYYSGGICHNGIGGGVPAGFTYTYGFWADNYSGYTRLNFTNSAKMKEFFKLGMGVCDRGASSYQNLGQNNCDYFLSGSMDIIIQFSQANSANMLATFIAKPRINQGFNYAGSLPSGWGLLGAALGWATGVYLPDPSYYQGSYKPVLQLQMAVSNINNSAGFTGIGYGDYLSAMNRTKIEIQVPNGKLESQSFNFNFNVGGVTAAQGVMSRCQTLNCSL